MDARDCLPKHPCGRVGGADALRVEHTRIGERQIRLHHELMRREHARLECRVRVCEPRDVGVGLDDIVS